MLGALVNPNKICTILLVDDDLDHLDLLAFAMTKAGFSVISTSSADHALSILSGGNHVAAILSDLDMPIKTGIDLLDSTRAMVSTSLSSS